MCFQIQGWTMALSSGGFGNIVKNVGMSLRTLECKGEKKIKPKIRFSK